MLSFINATIGSPPPDRGRPRALLLVSGQMCGLNGWSLLPIVRRGSRALASDFSNSENWFHTDQGERCRRFCRGPGRELGGDHAPRPVNRQGTW